LDSSTLQNPSSIFFTAGNYKVFLKVTSTHGCFRLKSNNLKFADHVDPAIIDYATVENNEYVRVIWIPETTGKPKLFNLERSIDNNNFTNILSVTPDVLEYLDKNVNVSLNIRDDRDNETEAGCVGVDYCGNASDENWTSSALVSGLVSHGISVYKIGVAPTPVISFLICKGLLPFTVIESSFVSMEIPSRLNVFKIYVNE